MTDDQLAAIRANLDKRPRFKTGDRVRVTMSGAYLDTRATVLDVRALQNLYGYVTTYFYTIRLDNLARIALTEEELTLADGEERNDADSLHREL